MNEETKQIVETLQQKADKEGVTRQTIWARSEKGKAYQKAYQKVYQKSDAYKAYRKAYKKSDAYKAYRKVYQKSDAYKAYQKAYQKSDAYKQNYERRNRLIAIALKEYKQNHN